MAVRPENSSELDAIVVATTARVRVAGLTLAERGRRVVVRAGATRVLVVDETVDHATISTWASAHPERPLIVVDATEHAVHVPLVRALEVPGGGARVVLDARGAFAGALRAEVAERAALVAAVQAGAAGVTALAARWREADVPTVVHGEVARHLARTARDRRAAFRYFYRGMVMKPQDSWLVRNINRKVSYPFTRLLLPVTWLSPNMISILVFLIGVSGCIYLTQPGYGPPVIGTLLLLFAGYLDGCDGEIARLRLESSKLGAWIDTMCDEATTVVSITCVGLHLYNTYGEPWIAWSVVLACALAIISVYCVYYFLLASGSSNSQDYPTSGGVIEFLKLFVRREMINLGSVAFAVAGAMEALYAGLVLGGVVSCAVLVPQHIQLRRARNQPLTVPTSP